MYVCMYDHLLMLPALYAEQCPTIMVALDDVFLGNADEDVCNMCFPRHRCTKALLQNRILNK